MSKPNPRRAEAPLCTPTSTPSMGANSRCQSMGAEHLKLWAQCLHLSQAPGLSLPTPTHVVPGAWGLKHSHGPALRHGIDQESRVQVGCVFPTSLLLYFRAPEKFQGARNNTPMYSRSQTLRPFAELLCLQRLEWCRGKVTEKGFAGQREAHCQVCRMIILDS